MMNDIITSLFLGVLDHLHVVLQAGLVGQAGFPIFAAGFILWVWPPTLAPPAATLSRVNPPADA